MKTGSSTKRHPHRAIAIGATALLATTVVGCIQPSQPANASPAFSANSELVAGTYYYHLRMNAEGARDLYDRFGTSSGSAGVASFITGLLPGSSAKAIAGALGAVSSAQFFTQGGVSGCSEGFTESITVTFVRGGFAGCVTNDRSTGGSF